MEGKRKKVKEGLKKATGSTQPLWVKIVAGILVGVMLLGGISSVVLTIVWAL